ncbi:MAG TPA: c-type cytochrome [Candidatus Obscuribacterales bacterium]
MLALLLAPLLAGCPSQRDEKAVASPFPAERKPWRWPDKLPAGATGELVSYGKELVAHTARHLGPAARDKSLRLAGNNLACASCHLADGTQEHAIGFVGIAGRFPAYYAPLDRKIGLSERINACFERSLNGKPLPTAGRELKALVAYLSWLSQEVPPGQTLSGSGLPVLEPPPRAAAPKAGEKLYAYHCAACHGLKGEGSLAEEKDPGAGYTFPPLWGTGSFGQGSNMARLLIATRYIKANMPLGRPVLTSAEAYDIAAYMLSHDRPAWPGAGKDYPNPATRPVDLPYRH